jgi:hypothetical protein
VRIANKNVKYHLNHLEIDRFTVGNAIRNIDHHGEIGFRFRKYIMEFTPSLEDNYIFFSYLFIVLHRAFF